MKIGIVGAGAIGGFFAARLVDSGHQVSVLARGATLATLRQNGLRLEGAGRTITANVDASHSAHELGPQELLVLAVKGHALPRVAAQLAPLMDADTIVVPAMNGLPWWYFLATQGPLAGHRLRSTDPDGLIEKYVPVDRVIGSVVYPSCASLAPGVVRHVAGERLIFGEPQGALSSRVEKVTQVFRDAGFDAESSVDVRSEIWIKLLGNMCWNPVSLLTGVTTDLLVADPHLYPMFIGMMQESLGLAAALGLDIRLSPEDRVEATRKAGRLRTSMLQDVEANRPVEMEGIVGAPLEAAQAIGVPVPLLETIYAIARMRSAVLGLLLA